MKIISKLSYFSLLFVVVVISCNSKNEGSKNADSPQNDSSQIFVAPSSTEKGLLKLNAKACYFDDINEIKKKIDIALENPDGRELEVIKSIMKYAGLPQNFRLYRGDISNALATMVNNQRFIIYNRDLFAVIDKMSESYWASVFILAHEIGHHLAYNISDTVNNINAELDADMFAASILFKMGADSSQAVAAVKSRFISNEADTKTHPSKSKRIAAIKKSWLEASEMRFTSAVPPEPYDQNEEMEFTTVQLWDIGLRDFERWQPDDSVESPLVKIENLSGIILYTQQKEYYNVQPKELSRKIDVTVLITGKGTDEKGKFFAINDKHTFDAWFCQSVEKDVYQFDRFFTPGRRIIFDTYILTEHDQNIQRISRAVNKK